MVAVSPALTGLVTEEIAKDIGLVWGIAVGVDGATVMVAVEVGRIVSVADGVRVAGCKGVRVGVIVGGWVGVLGSAMTPGEAWGKMVSVTDTIMGTVVDPHAMVRFKMNTRAIVRVMARTI